ncbi:MAG: transposase [Patescibacteria group bacterium]
MFKINERKHRLPRDLYIGQIICAFTICLEDRQPFFVSPDVFNQLENILLSTLKKICCEAHIYYFMPDHCHFVIEGKQESSNLYKCIVEFKQRSGYWFSCSKFGVKWQKDFYDHILRRDEDIIKQVKYILENVQRKGLARDWLGYPFRGSTLYNFDDWIFAG